MVTVTVRSVDRGDVLLEPVGQRCNLQMQQRRERGFRLPF